MVVFLCYEIILGDWSLNKIVFSHEEAVLWTCEDRDNRRYEEWDVE